MGRKPNPTVIGAFVVGALVLAVVGVLVFGSGTYFRSAQRYVMFFPGSVTGLSVGASVKFRGIDIGTVTDLRLVLQPDDKQRQVTIPVYVDVDLSRITIEGHPMHGRDPAELQRLIRRGLRAQLQAQSLVTGVLFIQVDLFPDTPVVYVLPQPSDPTEIPTVPTTLEEASSVAKEIITELRNIKLGPMVEKASQALQGVDTLVNSPALHAAVDALPHTMDKLDEAIASVRGLSDELRGEVGLVGPRIDGALEGVDRTLNSLRDTVESARVLIEPGSPLDHDLRAALRDVSAAANALAQLADFLERNPTALLYGKQSPPAQETK